MFPTKAVKLHSWMSAPLATSLLLLMSGALLISPSRAAVPNSNVLVLGIQQSLKKPQGLEQLLADWKRNPDSRQLFKALSWIANDSSQEDQVRYAGFMGALRLGGDASLDLISALATDASWLLRSGALKAAELLLLQPQRSQEHSLALAPSLLRTLRAGTGDRALVVRLEAVEALNRIQAAWKQAPTEFQSQELQSIRHTLCQTLGDSRNYSEGEPQ